MVDKAYPEITSISARKPIAIFEFGVIEDPQQVNKTEWIKNALHSVEGGTRYPRIKATIDLRINSSAKPAEIYRTMINSSIFVSKPQFNYPKTYHAP
jgi:hypothetical protein